MCHGHEHDITSLNHKFPWGPVPKPSNAGDRDMLHIRETSVRGPAQDATDKEQ